MVETIQKQPPHNLEAEEAVLGAILLDRDAIIPLAGMLKSDDFFRRDNGMIYGAAVALYEQRTPPDMITIASHLESTAMLDLAGGYARLGELLSAAPTSVHAEYYARMVVDAALLRRVIQAGVRIVNLGYDTARPAPEALSEAQAAIQAVAQDHQPEGGFVALSKALGDYFDRLETLRSMPDGLVGVPTGMIGLDAMTGGFQNGDLVVLAARPGAGKTSMGLGIAAASGRFGKTVGVFSLEMPVEQLVHRFLAMETGIDSNRLRLGDIHDDEWDLLSRALGMLAEVPVYIDDRNAVTITELRSRALSLKATAGLDMIIVDYLQLMHGSGRRDGNREREVSEISRGLKGLARELHIPVLAMAQLSRSVESRSSHIPMLSDLRESGSIEQDADVVMFIYREDLYDKDGTAEKGAAELHVAKHRNGPLGVVPLRFFESTTRFADYETYDA